MKKLFLACAAFACALCTQAYDIVATVSIEGDTKWYFDIELANNNIDFTAFQMDIALDGEAELKDGDLNSSLLTQRHSLVSALKSKGRNYRVVCYNLENKTFKEKEGPLFSFSTDGDINSVTINKIIFVKPDGTEVEADVFTKALDRNGDPDAVKEVSGEQGASKVIYNLDGKQVYRIDRRGIYIQNGKKIAK